MVMPVLYGCLPRQIKCGRKSFRIDPSFRTVLCCQQVLADKVLSEGEKIDTCVEFILQPKFAAYFMPRTLKTELFKKYFEDFVRMGERKREETERVFDFTQDAQYIYAAFFQCYGLDLMGRDRDLHWWSFMMLLGGLSNDTRFMEIVSIRTAKLPKPTKYNGEMRAELMRKKALLESSSQRRNGLNRYRGDLPNWRLPLRRGRKHKVVKTWQTKKSYMK